MRLPDGSGIALVKHIQEKFPQMPGGGGSPPRQHGDRHCFRAQGRSLDSSPNRSTSMTCVQHRAPGAESAAPYRHCTTWLRPRLSRRRSAKMLGESPAIQKAWGHDRKTRRVARRAGVYISGRIGHWQGTGCAPLSTSQAACRQTVRATQLRRHPLRAPWKVSSSATKSVAFTGAVQDKEGLFGVADGGTLFPDEVGDLPPAMQVKLLRAIQENPSVRSAPRRKSDGRAYPECDPQEPA